MIATFSTRIKDAGTAVRHSRRTFSYPQPPERLESSISTAGAAADRPAGPPATPAAQKSPSRPLQLSRPMQTLAQMARNLDLPTSFFPEPCESRLKHEFRDFSCFSCSQCATVGPDTAWRPWNRCVDFLSWWARHAFCVDLARICKLGGQKACLIVYASRCKALMKSAASTAFCASG